MTIALPTKPNGDQYEDFVAACLKVLGYFTETRLVLREGKKEILELDVVATPLGQLSEKRQIFEAKKEGMNFSNLFKLYGQRQYLNIQDACLASLKECDPSYAELFKSKGAEMAVRVCHIPLDLEIIENLAPRCNGFSKKIIDKIIPVAWFQQIGRRVAQANFVQEYNNKRGSPLYDQARAYFIAVQQSFFQPTPLDRAEALYSAYWNSPNLVGDFVSEIAASQATSARTIWNKLNDTGELLWLQYLMLVENTARIYIVKNALDDAIARNGAPLPEIELRIGTSSFGIPRHNLPPRFTNGLELLRTHPHSLRFPYLFQVFVELLGGVVFFKDKEELNFIADATGIPETDIETCLLILDEFFAPPGGGTCFYTQKDQLLCMKMIPGFVHGGGSFMRQTLYDLTKYQSKFPEMGWLLGHWHNALYYTLEPLLSKNEH